MTVKVVTDSGADLSQELAKDLDIEVVPVYLKFGDEVYRDGVDINGEEFYQKLLSSPFHPTTSQPSPSDFATVYKRLAKETDEIISIHLPSKLSGTYNSAIQGRDMAKTRCNIEVVDSESVTMGLGLVSLAAARVAQTGKNLQEVLAEVRETIPNIKLLGLFDTLKYLILGGRIGKAKGLVGSILNVKPMLTIKDGELVPAGQTRTRLKGIERLFGLVKNAFNIQEAAVVHSTTPDEANSMKERISSFLDKSRIHVTRLGPGLGCHAGPDFLAVAIRDKISDIKHKTEGSSNEASPLEALKKKIPHPTVHLPWTPADDSDS